jgi:hypothetical protein
MMGICPLNPNIFTDTNFAPSTSTLRHAYLPGSYLAGHDSKDSEFGSGSDSATHSDHSSEEGECLDSHDNAQEYKDQKLDADNGLRTNENTGDPE